MVGGVFIVEKSLFFDIHRETASGFQY